MVYSCENRHNTQRNIIKLTSVTSDGILRYEGQIDDHPQDSAVVGADDLRVAIASLFTVQAIQLPATEQEGTALVWRK